MCTIAESALHHVHDVANLSRPTRPAAPHLPHELAEDLRTVDYLGLLAVEHLADLTSDQGLVAGQKSRGRGHVSKAAAAGRSGNGMLNGVPKWGFRRGA